MARMFVLERLLLLGLLGLDGLRFGLGCGFVEFVIEVLAGR